MDAAWIIPGYLWSAEMEVAVTNLVVHWNATVFHWEAASNYSERI